MTSVPLSRTQGQPDRTARRQHLQRHRTQTLAQGIWRTCATLGIASGLVWALTLPRWTVVDAGDVEIIGNQLLSDAALQQALAWEGQLPASLLLLRPEDFVRRLQDRAPIERVAISRGLLPPNLTLAVTERPPVASTVPQGDVATNEPAATPATHAGALDSTGVWLPQSAFTAALVPPALEVRGYRLQQRERWAQLYAALEQSPVSLGEVTAIDFSDADNTILSIAQLGPVHLGASLQRLDEQLQVLATLQASLPQGNRGEGILFIDLRNPDAPAIRPATEKG